MATALDQPAAQPPPTTATPGGGPIVIDTQHDDMVHDSQLDYYGCKLATASSDRTVKIYDVSGNQYAHTATLQGHEGPVWEVSWAHPKFGVVLASCSFDGSVQIHRESSPGSWSVIHAARGLHDSSANGVAFAPHEHGLVCASAGSDGRVAFLTHHEDDTWAVEYLSDNALGVNAVAWAPYAKGGEERSVMRVATAGCDNRVRFYAKPAGAGAGAGAAWEEDPAPLGAGAAHTDWVRDVAWAPPVVPGRSVVASCSEDGTVLVWTQEEDGAEWTPAVLNDFGEPVWRLSWSVTGSILAVSSGDSSVTLWKAGLDGTYRQVSQVPDAVGQ